MLLGNRGDDSDGEDQGSLHYDRLGPMMRWDEKYWVLFRWVESKYWIIDQQPLTHPSRPVRDCRWLEADQHTKPENLSDAKEAHYRWSRVCYRCRPCLRNGWKDIGPEKEGYISRLYPVQGGSPEFFDRGVKEERWVSQCGRVYYYGRSVHENIPYIRNGPTVLDVYFG